MTSPGLIRLAGVAILLSSALIAHADGGMPLDHTHFLYEPGQPEDPLLGPMDADGLAGGGKFVATAHSRIETELKVAVKDADQHAKMRRALDLISRQGLMAKIAGSGYQLTYKRDADYGDVYLDDVTRTLGRHQAGARRRVVNGKDLELNVKPPGGLLTGPDGIFLSRAELGLPLGPNADLYALARVQSPWNPVPAFRSIYKGDLANLMDPSLALKTKRGRFVLGATGRGDGWESLIDLSSDHVYSIEDVHPKAKRQSIIVPDGIFGLEADLNHPGSQSGLVIPGVAWSPPHTSADAHRKALHDDAAVRELHRVGPLLLDYISTKHGVDFVPALAKYTQAALNKGLITARQVKRNERR